MPNLIHDIYSKGEYAMLSNFYPHSFMMGDVEIASMEGFLQSLKVNPLELGAEAALERQKEICRLTGKEAKLAGEALDWKRSGMLFWQGKAFHRSSREYQALLLQAYRQLSNNEAFAAALLSTRGILTHRIGRGRLKDTVLTRWEFTALLTRMRWELRRTRKS